MEQVIFDSVVNRLLSRSGSRAEVSLKPRFPGKRLVGGKYQPALHKVTLYKEPIMQQCFQLFGTMDRLEEYIAVVFAHELGHAEDDQLGRLCALLDTDLTVRERQLIALQIEENAWRYAEALLTDIDADLMNQIITESLAAYRRELQTEIA